MTREPLNDANQDERLNQVLLAYVEAREAGRLPDRHELLAAYPDLRSELEACLADYDEIERVAAPLRVASGSDFEAPISHFQSPNSDPPNPDASTPSVEGAAASNRPAGEAADRSEIGQLGDFRLLREVGRGGMGVVYEAEQISLSRRVALKVLPFAAAIDPRQLQRFKNEALAAAHLQHAHIVPVHAVGSERGVHYYAMQFIDGQSLAALIQELRKPGAAENSDRSGPPPEASAAADTMHVIGSSTTRVGNAAGFDPISRDYSSGRRRYFDWVARLGRQAALALEHAHQTGIVHRDVKPSNLLLDPQGTLWVADFGLAQIGGDAGLTMTGEVLGTLRYASPEQVLARRGIVDHRSDVYSLGATLYELLTLKPLFDGRDRHELLGRVANDDPVSPAVLDPTIPAELETIVLKALRKEPAERYATAQDLADDIDRFLDNRPILARRLTPVERLRKWGRRHPSVVIAGGILLVIVCAGSLVGSALIRSEQARTEAAHQETEAAYLRERQRAEEAESRFLLARRSVDELIQVSEEELINRPGLESVRKRLLTSALNYYQEFIEQRQDDPNAQTELLDTTRRVERILADLAVLRSASKLFLLGRPQVLDELGLSDAQRTLLQKLLAQMGRQWMESFRDAGRLSAAERGQRALKQARANEAAFNAVLTPAQESRLRQIGLQWDGPFAFRDPEVVLALRLTSEQREQIRTIEDDLNFQWMQNMRPDKTRSHSAEGSSAAKASIAERIRAVLTTEQARQWQEMIGEPVKQLFDVLPPENGREASVP